MKKILLFLAIVSSAFGANQLVTQDPSDSSGKRRVTGITIVADQITKTNSVTAISIVGVTNSVGSADAGKIPKLNASGQFSGSFIGSSSIPTSLVISTNCPSHTGSGSANTWTTIGSLTTTATNGSVTVIGRALQVSSGNAMFLRVRDTSTNSVRTVAQAATGIHPAQVTLCETLSADKTYFLEVASDGTSTTYTNGLAATGSNPVLSGCMGLELIQTP